MHIEYSGSLALKETPRLADGVGGGYAQGATHMASIPSIKGSVLATVIEKINKLLDSGKLSHEDTRKWLKPQDVALLEEDIMASGWYDIHSFTRMTELLLEVEGLGNTQYLQELGHQSARRLLETGIYSQLEYLRRSDVAGKTDQRARFETFGKELRLLTTMARSIYNFSTWVVKPDEDHEYQYILDVTEASDFPDSLCWRVEGFINEMAREGGRSHLWAWKRLSYDHIVFYMLSPV